MRSLIIGLLVVAGLLLLAGVALVVLIDPDDYRADIAAGLEALTGHEVQLDGPVGLSLIPQPTLSAAQASLASGPDADGAFHLAVDRLDLRVAVLPLLRGEFQVVEASLVGPVLRLERLPERPLDLLTPGDRARGPPLGAVRLQRVIVTGGDLVIADDAGAGAGRHLDQVDLDFGAESGAGPFVVAGEFREHGRVFSVAAELGRLDPRRSGALRLELAGRAPDGGTATVSYRGLVRLGGERPELSGDLAVEGGDVAGGARLLNALVRGPEADGDAADARPPGAPRPLGEPFALGGRLELTAAALVLDRLGLRVGANEASGRLALDLEAEPQLDLELRSPQLELGELSVAAFDLAAWPKPPPGLRGAIDVTVNAAAVGDATVRRVRLALTLPGDGRVAIDRAAAVLPGGTDVSFAGAFGTLAGDDTPLLSGSLEAVTDNLRALLDWLGLDTAAVPPGRLRTLSFTGDVALTPLLLRVTRSELRVDASTLTGSAAIGLGPRRQVAMAVSLDRFNADAYLPDLARPDDRSAAWREAALAFDAAIELQLDLLTWGDQRLRDVRVRGRLEGGLLTLEELAVADLAELRLQLAGTADLREETVDLAVEAETANPVRALRVLGYEPPPTLAGFAPVRLDGTVDGPLTAAALELEIGAGDLRLGLSGEVAAPPAPWLDVAWQLAFPDLPDLLRRLGVPEVAGPALAGPIELAGALDLGSGGAFEARFAGTLGPMATDGAVAWETREPRPHLRLDLTAEPLVGEALAVLAAVGTPGRGNPFAPGNLSRRPLGADALGALDFTIDVATEDLRYGGDSIGPVSLAAALRDRTLELRRLAARPFGGTLSARGRLAGAEDGAPTLALDLDLTGVETDPVLALFDVPPALRGAGDVRLTATTTGRSAFDLVGNLDGELEVRVRRGRLSGVDYAPVRRALDDGAEHPNMAQLRRDLLRGETPVALFGGVLALRRGVLNATDLGAMLEGGVATVAGTVDLLFWAADLTLEFVPDTPEEAPAVSLRVVGPLQRPQVVPRLDALDAYLAAAAERADAAAPEDAGTAPREPEDPPQDATVAPQESATTPGE